MIIRLLDAGKRFRRDWIFRNLNLTFNQGDTVAILGPNGSGKSTLLQCISTAITLSEGKIEFEHSGKIIEPENFFSHTSFCAPYLELPEELTLHEMIRFHFKFKKILDGISEKEVMEISTLAAHQLKQIAQFSSGMKQRLKFTLALLSDVPVVLLDEPCTNLDEAGILWYQEMIRKFKMERTIVVASNQSHEYDYCRRKILVGGN